MPSEKFSDKDKRLLERAYKDAKAKVDGLKQRQRDEDEQAEAEDREPFNVEPLTPISTGLLARAINSIETVPEELAEAVKTHRRVFKQVGERPTNILSEQLVAILDAAKLVEQAPAPEPPAPAES